MLAMAFFSFLDNAYAMEIAALAEYKALITYGPDSILFKTLYSFDLSKPPDHYSDAICCPDADIWHAAMQHKMDSLCSQRVFQVVSLSPGQKPIGV